MFFYEVSFLALFLTLKNIFKMTNNKRILEKIMKSTSFVDDFAGFNFKKVAEMKEGTIYRFMCSDGVGFCLKEDEKDRFKHCKAILIDL